LIVKFITFIIHHYLHTFCSLKKLTKISMGALTVRNLTYLAVGLCVFALIYLIRQSIAKNSADRAATAAMGDPAAVAATNQSLGGGSPATDDNLGAGSTASTTTTAAAPATLVSPVTPTAASTTTVRTAPSGGGSSTSTTVAEASAQNHTKQTLTPKGGSGSAGTKTTATDNKTYTTAGDKGDFWVIAGSFKDADGANTRVAELKKKGFAYATAVKDGSSGNTRVVAAKFPYNGGAEAEVRNLKKHSIDAFISKQ
jgi:cell division septation protein DedD